MEIIRTENLTKRYGKTVAVNRISIHVNAGEIYGFLGLNGAGKTTLIRTLLNMVKPDCGNVFLFGEKLKSDFEHWNEIGYLVETPHAYPNLSVYENLKIFYKLRQLSDPDAIENIMYILKLNEYRDTKAGILSLGNQQRLGLAKALIHSPKLLILDEPVNGLDPRGIVEVREFLLKLAKNGSTIFLSSHLLGEISKLASRIGIIHEGKLIKEVTSKKLLGQVERKLLLQTSNNKKALDCLLDSDYYAFQNRETREIEIRDKKALAHPEKITELLTANNLPPKQIYLFTEDLENYFLRTIRTRRL